MKSIDKCCRPHAGHAATGSSVLRATVAAIFGSAAAIAAGPAALAADCEVVADGLRAPIGSVFT
jgi:hypothetical protein